MERFTPTEHVDSLAEFLESLRVSMQQKLTEHMAEHHGVKLWVAVDVQCHPMFEVRFATVQITTHTVVLHNDFQIKQFFSRLGAEMQMRNANFLRKRVISCSST